MNKLRRWVLDNCRFAQVQDPRSPAIIAAEQKHIQSIEAMQVVADEPEREHTFSDDPASFEPGTVPGPVVGEQGVMLRGRVFWPPLLEREYQMPLEESLRTTMNEAPPKALAGLIRSGDKVEVKNVQIVPSEPDMFDVTIQVDVSGGRGDDGAGLDYDSYRDDMAADNFQGP